MPHFSPLIRLGHFFSGPRGSGLADPDSLLSPDERHNGRLMRLESPLTSLAMGTVSSFFALFAIRLGGSDTTVGWLTSGPALINLFWFFPCGRLVSRFSNFGQPLALSAVLHRLVLMALALVPFLPADWRPWGGVALVACASFPSAMWALAFHSTCGEIFSPRHLPRVIGLRWAIAHATAVIGALLLGRLIDLVPFPFNFQVLFVGVGLLTLATAPLVLKLRYPPREAEAGEGIGGRSGLSTLSLRRHRRFLLFEAGILVVYLALFSAMPIFRIYWVRDLGASGGWIGALAAGQSIGMALGNFLWGRWSRPDRDRWGLLIATAGYAAIFPFLTSIIGSLILLVGVGLLSGLLAGGNDILIFNRVTQLSPRRDRPSFVAMHNLTVNAVGFLGPLWSTALVGTLGAPAVLKLVAGVGLAGALLLFLLGGMDAEKVDAGAPA